MLFVVPKGSGSRYVLAEMAFPWFIVDEILNSTWTAYSNCLHLPAPNTEDLVLELCTHEFYDYLFFISSKAYLPVKVVLDVRCCNGLYKVDSGREFDVCSP